MSKLYGPDEGYETYLNHGTAKKRNKVQKATKQSSIYSTVREKISDLIEDQELVIKGPPFNPVVDLDALPHDEFVARASQVMTSVNPEGHPPPGVLMPTMNSLLSRLESARFVGHESYASVADPNRSPSPRLSPMQSFSSESVLSADRSTPTEDRVLKTTAAEKLVSVQRSSSPKKTRSKKVMRNVKFAIPVAEPLVMEKKQRGTQYAISTVTQKSIPRAGNKRQSVSTERLGHFHSGTKKVASSTILRPEHSVLSAVQDVIDLDAVIQDNSSLESDIEFYPVALVDQPNVLTDTETTTNLRSATIHHDVRALRSNDIDTIMIQEKDDTDMSEISSEAAVDLICSRPSTSTSSTPVHLQFNKTDIDYLEGGNHGNRITSKLVRVEEMLGEAYLTPPNHDTSVFGIATLMHNVTNLPPVSDGDHVLSPGERFFCENQLCRWRLSYIIGRDLHNYSTTAALRAELLDWPTAKHVYLLVMASALTNTTWSYSSTFREDKHRLWVVLGKHGIRTWNSVSTAPEQIPLGVVTMEFLLALPIGAVIDYLAQQRVITRISWFPTESRYDNVRSLRELPADTKVPFNTWIVYLIDLVNYLNAVMFIKDDSYKIIRDNFQSGPVILTSYDATVFLRHHFPLESSRLNTEAANLALLVRAYSFACSTKYSGDVYEQCSESWAVFLHFLCKGKYPTNKNGNDYQPDYDMVECRLGLNNQTPETFTRMFPFEKLLYGPTSHLPHFLQEHKLGQRLYGPTIATANAGTLKLMVTGCILYYYMLLHGHRDVDKHMPTGFLAHILYAKGVLQPTAEPTIKFSSSIIPVHKLATASKSVTAILHSMMPVVLVPPMETIQLGVVNQDYRDHYTAANVSFRIMDRTLVDKAIQAHEQVVIAICTFRRDPALFPSYRSFAVHDYSPGVASGYVHAEGMRMVNIVHALHLDTSTIRRRHIIPAPTFSPKKQSTLQQDVTGRVVVCQSDQQEIRIPGLSQAEQQEVLRMPGYRSELYGQCTPGPQPVIITLKQLKANRAAALMTQSQQSSASTIDYPPSDKVQASWSEFGVNVTEGYDDYIATFLFHTTLERELLVGDKVVLLDTIRYTSSLTNMDILNRTHLSYHVDRISSTGVAMSRVSMLHTPSEAPKVLGYFPPTVTLLIKDEYILLESREETSDTSGYVMDLQAPQLHRRDSASHKTTSGKASQGKRHHDDDDTGSEDSEARKLTKKSTMEVNGETFEIYGKPVLHDNLARSVSRRMMTKSQMIKLLKTSGHGYFGNNITVKNIIDGIIKLADDDQAGSMFNKLNISVNHNKLQVDQQAWRQHPELFEGIAYNIYEFGHNISKTSIRCEHFLPLSTAVAINYTMTTHDQFKEHFKGWKQVYQELLGIQWSNQLQEFLTEMSDNSIGARNGVPYLKALAEAWRSELYRYASRSEPFQIMGSSTYYDPRDMSTEEWLSILRMQWQDFKNSLTALQEFEFTQNKTLSKIVECKPLGHKPKVLHVEEKGKHEKKVPDKAPARQGKLQLNQAPAKRGKDEPRRKSPAHDNEIVICIGDLLNHYGSTQQIACKAPCRYVHYKDIPPGLPKAAIIKRFQSLAQRFSLTEDTIALMKRKVSADAHFK